VRVRREADEQMGLLVTTAPGNVRRSIARISMQTNQYSFGHFESHFGKASKNIHADLRLARY
jgi:hypothetical protein